jgi:hypothetical protein
MRQHASVEDIRALLNMQPSLQGHTGGTLQSRRLIVWHCGIKFISSLNYLIGCLLPKKKDHSPFSSDH